ncbi:unnamed protein product [Adineta steineri]|uniref:RRM domain-containing protein n=1 Tax=Adineta steineri TaxID=433720 RepID=A0A820AG64_9BILA|nr:unnamed protein product [Adineta steineri]CAF4184834.1 unnamed protein product [Adineta steineri]
MSFESFDIPTIEIKDNEMKDLLKYLYKNKSLLKENGAIKLFPTSNFKNLLKKTPINVPLRSTIQQIKQIDNDNLIYSVKINEIDETRKISKENILISDEMFWLLLPNGFNTQDISSISIIKNKTLFLKRIHRNQFDFHQLPYQSLLKLSGKQFCKKYSSTLIKAHGPVVIFPLSSNKQDLCQLNYHHEGDAQTNPSICLGHDEILIDPLLLNKYNIRYKKVIQKPNEILILSGGILSQSFTQNEILCESIHFALPSWFYNEFPKNSSLCHCKLSSNLNKDESIDLSVYNDESIQGYIQKYLQLNTNQDKDLSFLDNINEEDFLMNICDESMTFSQFNNETDFNELFSSNDFFNDIFMNNNQCESSNNAEILNIIDTPPSSNDQLSRIKNQCEIDCKKILYLLNLNKKIRKNDLGSYFIGSTKILLRQSQLPPHVNYAFIFHRTNLQAEYNRKRVISSSHFRSNCQIEFVKNLSQLSNKNEVNEKWNIVITQIPENVTENDLKNLFFNSYQIKYIPARIVQKSNTNQKILFGFAFLSFKNLEQVDEIMNNAYKYQINNQPLILSYYNKIES